LGKGFQLSPEPLPLAPAPASGDAMLCWIFLAAADLGLEGNGQPGNDGVEVRLLYPFLIENEPNRFFLTERWQTL
jgi:hypothetical protein